ncbi:MAG: YdeI/OmpD-associated family protein [Bacteroidota bacterium]
MTPTFFTTQLEFRKWLGKHHAKETELLVGFYKVGSGQPSMTWSQSVDEALCFGWIDGVRKSIDQQRYTIRFTPRRATSIWSAINIDKVEQLTKSGLMKPAGLDSFALRKEHKSKIYSHENEGGKLTKEFEKIFKANKKAWRFFTTQAPSYQKVMIHWITTAKQPATQLSRLNKTITESAGLKRVL